DCPYRSTPYSSRHSHPDHVGDHGCAAGGYPSGVRTEIAGLHVAQVVGYVMGCVGRVVYSGVDYSLVDAMPENRGRAVDQWLDEQVSVKLIDVILVDDGLVEPSETGDDARRQFGTAEIECPGKCESENGGGDRNQHEQSFSCAAGSFAC